MNISMSTHNFIQIRATIGIFLTTLSSPSLNTASDIY